MLQNLQSSLQLSQYLSNYNTWLKLHKDDLNSIIGMQCSLTQSFYKERVNDSNN